MDINRLKEQIQKKSASSNMESFEKILVIFLGVEPREYFPKLKNAEGGTVKDDKGNAMRSPTARGFTYTFSQLGTSKIVKIVLPKRFNMQLLGLYEVSGLGYDIKQSSMIFIQENCGVVKYEQD